MVLQTGGRVQFAGVDRWIERKGNSSSLPNYRVPDLRLHVVDFTNTKIIYEGLKSLGKNVNTLVWYFQSFSSVYTIDFLEQTLLNWNFQCMKNSSICFFPVYVLLVTTFGKLPIMNFRRHINKDADSEELWEHWWFLFVPPLPIQRHTGIPGY